MEFILKNRKKKKGMNNSGGIFSGKMLSPIREEENQIAPLGITWWANRPVKIKNAAADRCINTESGARRAGEGGSSGQDTNKDSQIKDFSGRKKNRTKSGLRISRDKASKRRKKHASNKCPDGSLARWITLGISRKKCNSSVIFVHKKRTYTRKR